MKWCILVNDAPFLSEFLGKVFFRLLKQGDECVLVFTSKFAEYAKAQYFPKEARVVSKVDWCLEHYDPMRKDYGDLTWRELFSTFDRMVRWPWEYQTSAKILAQEYQFFEQFLQTERPDAVLSEPPGGVTGEIVYFLSLEYGIPYLGITDSRISGHLDIWNSEYTDKRYKQTFDALSSRDISGEKLEFAERFILEFLSHKRLPSYYGIGRIRFTLLGYISHYLERVREVGGPLWRYIRVRKKFKDVDFESESRLRVALKAPWELALRQLRIALQKHLYQRAKPKDDFYVFPLHLQPESSTLVQAMQYSDQASAIRNIAFALPFPSKLYVKEHPAAIGTKPNSFYQKIQIIPNVQLIASQANMQELISNSQGVITLTGTAGMEAVMAGKPAYVLGNVFYEYHPLCRRPKNIDELREYILVDRKHGVPRENLKEINLRFVVSYLRNIIPGVTVAALSRKDSNDYEQIASGLRRVAQLHKKSLSNNARE